MKDYKILLISFILLIFMIGAVSAVDIDSNDTSSASVDESTVGIDLPIGPINPDPFIPGFDPDDEDPTDVEVDVKEIYVKDTGNDSNNGSSESPYATVNRAVSDVNSSNDATIYIGEGTYILDESLNIDLNHKTFGGNLKFIGAGADKTFIDGQNTFCFATIGSDTNVTLKDLTITNCKNTNGGTLVCNGNLTADNCVFNNSYATSYNGGFIYARGMVYWDWDPITDEEYMVRIEPVISIINSKFISSYVNSRNNIMNKYGGGAIYAQSCYLYLENNSFVDAKLSQRGGFGVAIYSSDSKNYLINNEFINLTTGTNDASIYIDGVNEAIIVGNNFINCSNPSTIYSIVYLGGGDYVFENNTFINSSNSVGNIYALGNINKLNFVIDVPVINVGNKEVNEGVVLPITKITDNNGNLVKTSTDFKINLTSENNSFTCLPTINGNITTIDVGIPENGIYNLTILYNKNIETGEYLATTDVLTIVNITLSNEPVELYVSPEGNDANTGAYDSPFKTIQHAIDVGFEKTFTVTVHLLKGTYSGEGNVELIVTKGILQIIGEKYGETVIDGNNTNWFLSLNGNSVVENLTFINGKSTNNLFYRGTLKNCIITNNQLNTNNRDRYVMSEVVLDNVNYTNNYGVIYPKTISNSYFANNKAEFTRDSMGSPLYGGFIICNDLIENSIFINNTAPRGGVIYSSGGLISRNNYYANNKAFEKPGDSYSTNYGDYGVIYTGTDGTYIFENDTFENNYATNCGVIGYDLTYSPMAPVYTFSGCKFINNSAEEGGVIITSIGTFTNCEFINNTADYGGAISLKDFTKDSYTLELNNVVFDGNIAKIKGNDIYLSKIYSGSTVYAIDLTINFNDLNIDSFTADLTVNVTAPCGAQISGSTIYFVLNNEEIGSAELINNVATLNYAGFDEGKYNLTGYMSNQASSVIINDGTINVKLDGILDKVTYYVSNNGSDESGNGSQTNPFKSISHAVAEASKKCHNITINIAEGKYSGDLNNALTLSSLNNLTLIGAGAGRTVIDGENNTYFATIAKGENKIIISDLTIKHMLPDNRQSKTIDLSVPITIEEGASLVLNNVELSDNHGGDAIILNNGNLTIINSVITRNGLSANGIIDSGNGINYAGNVYIYNSTISDNYLGTTKSNKFNGILSGKLVVVNNTVFKGNYIIVKPSSLNPSDFVLIKATDIIIENSNVSSGGNNESLISLGFDESVTFNPAFTISGNTNMTNTLMINDFEGTIYSKDTTASSTSAVCCPCALNTYNSRGIVLNIYNSSFTNFKYIWMVNGGFDFKYTFDGCLFNNITYVALSRTALEGTQYNITNSVFLFDEDVIMSQKRFSDTNVPNVMANNNYWGNSQPIMYFLGNSGIKDQTYNPNTWVILTVEDGVPAFKLTDGENVTDYEGTLPAEISYVADENGDVIPVLNLAGTGYKLSVDENGSIVLNTTEPMKNIVPKVAVNETVFANDTIAVINDGSKFNAVFTNKWGDPLKDTNVSFIVGEKTINATTDANGTATFDIDFALGQYIVSVINPVTGQSIEKTISVITEETTFASDVNATYNDGSKFSAKFTDEFGVPLANTNVTFIVGEKTINATTDVNGTASFDIDLKPGIFNVDITNPTTLQNISRSISVTTDDTITANDVTVTYGDAAKFAATFTDQYGVALAYTNVTFKVGENTINATTDVNGTASFDVNFDAGKYNVTIANPVTGQAVTKAIVVSKLATKLTATKVNMVYNTGKSLKATLKDSNGNALAKQKVYIKINGKTFERTTNTNGQVSLKISLPVKTYTATITYKGTTNYVKSSASVKVVVKKASPKMTAKAKTFKTKTKKYTIVLKDNKGKAMKKAKVTLTTKVKGKTVKLTVKTKNNGKATFNLKKLVKGKYTASVKFAGNKNFKATTKKVKITVKK